MEELTISDVSRRAGLRASAIRYYESVGLLPPPRRVSGRRRYSVDVLRRLTFIQVARAAGLTITEIRTLMGELDEKMTLSERWQTLAHQKLTEVDALITRVQSTKMLLERGLDCRCANLEECMDCIVRAQAGS